jgi:hypothetical protein
MKKNKTLSEKLKSYSLFAGSVIASSIAAQGQVVYVDVNPDRELGGVVPPSFPDVTMDTLDLNNDGLYDFKLTMSLYDQIATSKFSFREKIDGLFNPSNAIRTYSIEYVPFALKLNCGDSVPQFNFYGFFYANFAFQFGASAEYNWDDVDDKYVGLRFKAGTETHYAWLRVAVNTNDSVPNMIVKAYAYEKTPDKKIAVCDTGFGTGVAIPLIDEPRELVLYPNPSDGHCVIRLDQPINTDMELVVKDALGREMTRSLVPNSPSGP